jgi:hypothetical protein
MSRLRWRWRRWRARHYVWAAMNAWLANPTQRTRDAYQRALDYQDHVWTARP